MANLQDLLKQKDVTSYIMMAGMFGVILAAVGFLLCRRRSRKRLDMQESRLKFQLFHTPLSPSVRCMWFLSELQPPAEDFSIVHYNPMLPDEKEEEHFRLNVNPHGTVPVLLSDVGENSTEGGAICMFLSEYYGSLLPEPYERFNFLNISIYATSTADQIVMPLFLELYRRKEEEREEERIEMLTMRCKEVASMLENHLMNRDYVCGEVFTAADVILGFTVFIMSLIRGGQLLSEFPAVQAYLARIKKRPTFTPSIGTAREWITGFPEDQEDVEEETEKMDEAAAKPSDEKESNLVNRSNKTKKVDE